MNEELSYILLTPYTIMKSRTGGVLARLLSRSDVELVAAQMIAPTAELAREYAESIRETVTMRNKDASHWFHDYVISSFSPAPDGRRHRVLMLIFKGIDTSAKLFQIAGEITSDARAPGHLITGETIRDTYADIVLDPETGQIQYFEPAVLTPPIREHGMRRMKMLADFAAGQSNIVENVTYKNPDRIERTLVIIKPDNWRSPSSRPGSIVDMFSRTGLRIIACKVYQMSVSEALQFYGPVKEALRKKLAPRIGEKAKEIIERELKIKLCDRSLPLLTDCAGLSFADNEFSKIIEFMTGTRPEECPEDKLEKPGKVKCVVLLYEGENAVAKIRDVLGPTDPSQAPGGTVRKDFGQDILVNTAHASDSPENARREMEVVKMHQNNLSRIVKDYLESKGACGG
ncbi:MAG: hypothetical protein JW808_07535 [Victivallales bacterium]|nr:hypothetical protein [Victivallales bacterium]